MTDNRLKYDLEERTFQFANNCRNFVEKLPKSIANIDYAKQLIRSSSSPAANYIEANESLSQKDCILRIKICRKEARETQLWLKLCDLRGQDLLKQEQEKLIQEMTELVKIFHSIISKLS